MRSRKTRNQRKRDICESIVTGLFVFVLVFTACLLLCGAACEAWLAEEPITYEQHISRYVSTEESA